MLTAIAIYGWRTRATPAARAMSKESHGAEPREGAQIVEEETVIESPSRQDAAPGVDPILLGGSASAPVNEEVSIKREEQEQTEVRPQCSGAEPRSSAGAGADGGAPHR